MQSLLDIAYYATIGNPITSGAIYCTKTAAGVIGSAIGATSTAPPMVRPEPEQLWKLASKGGPYLRIAALSGAAAVILGAYGTHRSYPLEEQGKKMKKSFDTANDYHYRHSLAMLAIPLCHRKLLVASFFMTGIVLFSGTCYYFAFTGKKTYAKLTPIGGWCLIIGWLAMLL